VPHALEATTGWNRTEIPARARNSPREVTIVTKKPLTNDRVKVTFTSPEDVDVERASVVGEFNDWDSTTHPMKRDR
jgi:sRNA-binding carbon storage regulator CsrA